MSHTFEVSIDAYEAALQLAHDEIEDATGSRLPSTTNIWLEFIVRDGDYMFYRVTLSGLKGAEIAEQVRAMQEPCPPPVE